MTPSSLTLRLFLLLLIAPVAGHAQWFPDGTPIAEALFHQAFPAMVPDGSGGAVIAWADQRDGGYDIYAQRVDAFGQRLWTSNGIPVAASIGNQTDVALAPDGSGGAIVVWEDDQNGFFNHDLHAQRIDASGSLRWGAGVPISTAIGTQRYPVAVSDDEGGAIIAWEDLRGGTFDVYAQRVNFLGSRVWTANGIAARRRTTRSRSPRYATDSAASSWPGRTSATAPTEKYTRSGSTPPGDSCGPRRASRSRPAPM